MTNASHFDEVLPADRRNGATAQSPASRRCDFQYVKVGETLYFEGDESRYCYEIVSGTMKESNVLEDGRCHIIEFYSAGELIGLSEDDRRPYTAEAVTHCTLRRFPREDYLELVAASPERSQRLLQSLMRQLLRTQHQNLVLGRRTAGQRIAEFILRLCEEQRSTQTVKLAMTRQDIADHLGLTIETVCRILTEFKKCRLINMPSARTIIIKNKDMLEAFSNGRRSIQ